MELIRRQHGTIRHIPDDDYFELMMRNAWHIAGGWKLRAKKTRMICMCTAMELGNYITHLQMANFHQFSIKTTSITGDFTARQCYYIYIVYIHLNR